MPPINWKTANQAEKSKELKLLELCENYIPQNVVYTYA